MSAHHQRFERGCLRPRYRDATTVTAHPREPEEVHFLDRAEARFLVGRSMWLEILLHAHSRGRTEVADILVEAIHRAERVQESVGRSLLGCPRSHVYLRAWCAAIHCPAACVCVVHLLLEGTRVKPEGAAVTKRFTAR